MILIRQMVPLLAAVALVGLPAGAFAADDDEVPSLDRGPGALARPGIPGPPGPVFKPPPPAPADDEEEPEGGSGGSTGSGGSGTSRGSSGSSGPGGTTGTPDPSQAGEGTGNTRAPADDPQRAPAMGGAVRIRPDWVNISIYDLVKYFAELTGRQFILGDPKELDGKVTIISHKKVPVWQAYQAFLSALEVAGYTTTQAGNAVKIVKSSEAANTPIAVNVGDQIPYSDQIVTQLITPENVSVSEVSSVVSSLISKDGKVIAYQSSNTLIITDHAYNIRRVFKVLSELDVGAPKSRMEFYGLGFAQASDVLQLIEQLYGTSAASSSTSSSSSTRNNSRTRRNRRNNRTNDKAAAGNNSSTAGKATKYIDKIIADERTNSIIVLANDEGHAAVQKLLGEVDVDVDLTSRSQIHTIKLEHAKAQEVMDVLNRLSGGSGSSSSNTSTRNTRNQRNQANQRNLPGQRNQRNQRGGATGATGAAAGVGAAAVFDNGLRIAHDESTNSLVIIASPEDFRVISNVVSQLDEKRKQVFIDAVILELTSEDTSEIGIGIHGPISPGGDGSGIASAQLGAQSLGLSQDLLTGMALGVFGPQVSVPLSDGTSMSVPAFGIVLHAIETFAGVDIVSNPAMMALDNTEAKIMVGRKIPFPTSTTYNNLGQPIISFTREDVATTLEITPRINSSNHVTMEIRVEVSEVERDDQSLDPLLTGGPTTSNREVETTALVGDNQTVVLGGLMGITETKVETKIPVLGDLPLIGALFRGRSKESRKTNLLIFLTPHIIDDDNDLEEIMRVKEAQYREFRKRFFGRSKERQVEQIRQLLRGSMNIVDRPSMYRTSVDPAGVTVGGEPISDATKAAINHEQAKNGFVDRPGDGAGSMTMDQLESPARDGEYLIEGVDPTVPADLAKPIDDGDSADDGELVNDEASLDDTAPEDDANPEGGE